MLHRLNQYGAPETLATGAVHQEDLQPNEGLRKWKHQAAPPLLRANRGRGHARGMRGVGWRRGFNRGGFIPSSASGSGSGSRDNARQFGNHSYQRPSFASSSTTTTSTEDMNLKPTQGDTTVSSSQRRRGSVSSVASALHQIRENALTGSGSSETAPVVQSQATRKGKGKVKVPHVHWSKLEAQSQQQIQYESRNEVRKETTLPVVIPISSQPRRALIERSSSKEVIDLTSLPVSSSSKKEDTARSSLFQSKPSSPPPSKQQSLSTLPLPTPRRSQLSSRATRPPSHTQTDQAIKRRKIDGQAGSSNSTVPYRLESPMEDISMSLSQSSSKSVTHQSSAIPPIPTPRRSQFSSTSTHPSPTQPWEELDPPSKRQKVSGGQGSKASTPSGSIASSSRPAPRSESAHSMRNSPSEATSVQHHSHMPPPNFEFQFLSPPMPTQVQPQNFAQALSYLQQSFNQPISQPPPSQPLSQPFSQPQSQPPPSQRPRSQSQTHTAHSHSQTPQSQSQSQLDIQPLLNDPRFQSLLATQLASQITAMHSFPGSQGPLSQAMPYPSQTFRPPLPPSQITPYISPPSIFPNSQGNTPAPAPGQGTQQNPFAGFLYLAANGAFNAYLESLGMAPPPPQESASSSQAMDVPGFGPGTSNISTTRINVPTYRRSSSSSSASSEDVPLSQQTQRSRKETSSSFRSSPKSDDSMESRGADFGDSRSGSAARVPRNGTNPINSTSRTSSAQNIPKRSLAARETPSLASLKPPASFQAPKMQFIPARVGRLHTKSDDEPRRNPGENSFTSGNSGTSLSAAGSVEQGYTHGGEASKGRDKTLSASQHPPQFPSSSTAPPRMPSSSTARPPQIPSSSMPQFVKKPKPPTQPRAMAGRKYFQTQTAIRGRGRNHVQRGVPIAVPTKKSLPPQGLLASNLPFQEEEESSEDEEKEKEEDVRMGEAPPAGRGDEEIIIGVVEDVREEAMSMDEHPQDVLPPPAEVEPSMDIAVDEKPVFPSESATPVKPYPPLPKRSTPKVKPEPISPPPPPQPTTTSIANPTPPVSSPLQPPSNAQVSIKSEPSAFTLAPSQPPEIAVRREPSPPSKRLVTESCSRFPMRPNCLKTHPGWEACRREYARAEWGKLSKFGVKRKKIFFRDDGMVIEWTSDVPLWSDTLLPAETPSLAAMIEAAHHMNAVSSSHTSKRKRSSPRTSDQANNRNKDRSGKQDNLASTKKRRMSEENDVVKHEVIDLNGPLTQICLTPKANRKETKAEDISPEVPPKTVLPIPKRREALARISLVKMEGRASSVKSENVDVKIVFNNQHEHSATGTPLPVLSQVEPNSSSTPAPATSIPDPTPIDDPKQENLIVESDDSVEAKEVADVLTNEKDRIQNEAIEFLQR